MVGNCDNNNAFLNDGWDDTTASTYSEPDNFSWGTSEDGQESDDEGVSCVSTGIEDTNTEEVELSSSERLSTRSDDGSARFVWLNLHVPESPEELIEEVPLTEINESITSTVALPSPRSPSLQALAKKTVYVFLQKEEETKEIVERKKWNVHHDIVALPNNAQRRQIETVWDAISNDHAKSEQSNKEIEECFAFLKRDKC